MLFCSDGLPVCLGESHGRLAEKLPVLLCSHSWLKVAAGIESMRSTSWVPSQGPTHSAGSGGPHFQHVAALLAQDLGRASGSCLHSRWWVSWGAECHAASSSYTASNVLTYGHAACLVGDQLISRLLQQCQSPEPLASTWVCRPEHRRKTEGHWTGAVAISLACVLHRSGHMLVDPARGAYILESYQEAPWRGSRGRAGQPGCQLSPTGPLPPREGEGHVQGSMVSLGPGGSLGSHTQRSAPHKVS